MRRSKAERIEREHQEQMLEIPQERREEIIRESKRIAPIIAANVERRNKKYERFRISRQVSELKYWSLIAVCAVLLTSMYYIQ